MSRTNAPRLASVEAKAAAWSALLMPSGTSVAVTVTRVPAPTASTIHVIVMVPANDGSSDTKSTSSTIRRGGSTAVRDADALLVWGGDPLFLAGWMRRSGLTVLLPTLRSEAVYVGVSAGSMVAASTFVETYDEPPRADAGALESEDVVFATPRGDVDRILVTGRGAGLVDFAVIPHLEHPHHPDASSANAEKWAARIPTPTYAIDDDTAVAVVDGAARVVSEGRWKLLRP